MSGIVGPRIGTCLVSIVPPGPASYSWLMANRWQRRVVALVGLLVLGASGALVDSRAANGQSPDNVTFVRRFSSLPPSSVFGFEVGLLCGSSRASQSGPITTNFMSSTLTLSATSTPCQFFVTLHDSSAVKTRFEVAALIDGVPTVMSPPLTGAFGSLESRSGYFSQRNGLVITAVVTPVAPRPLVTVSNVVSGPEANPGTSYPMTLSCNTSIDPASGFDGTFALRAGESRTFTELEYPYTAVAATDAEVQCYVRETDRRGMTLSMSTSGYPGIYDENGYRSAPALRGGSVVVMNTAGNTGTRVAAGWTIARQVTGTPLPGNDTIPNVPGLVVAVNVTVTETAAPGYVVVYDCGALPSTSNLNFAAGETRANLVFVRLSGDGRVCFHTSATVHLLADIFGYFVPLGSAANLQAVPVSRIVDTRYGTGGSGKVTPVRPLKIVVDELPGFVKGEVAGAVLNVTVTEPVAPGYVVVHPCGVMPATSNVNFLAGESVANLVVVPPNGSGEVCVSSSADTHLVVDVTGWFPTATPTRSAGFVPQPPSRLIDTRADGLGRRNTFSLSSASGTGGRMLNLTVTEPTEPGWVSAVGCPVSASVSNVNFRAGQTVANAALVPSDGQLATCVYTPHGTHVVVDELGYFASQIYRSMRPVRILDTRP